MKKWQSILIFFIPLIVGVFSSIFVNNNFYNEFNIPTFAPPQILFPIVWTILYLLMGWAWNLILKCPNKKKHSTLFGIQIFLNFLWVILFFKAELFLLSFIVVLILDVLVFYIILTFHNYNKLSADLLIPYLIWICFASYLNWVIYLIN